MQTIVLGALLTCVALPVRADTIDDYVALQMKQLRVPGLALAVVRDGKVETVRAYGKANLELNVPVSRDTVFELGSLTKQFTAIAVMMLVEAGKLGLDDSIGAHLPETPESWRDITIRRLLTHSSGLQDYLTIPGLADQAHVLNHREMTRLFVSRLTQEFAPGESWAYSNSGYLLLGDIIERVSGQTYWEFLRTRVFAAAGMPATRSSEPRAIIQNRAAGYGWSSGGFENRPSLSENAYAAGSIVSTITDLTRWSSALHADSLVSRATRELIWTPLTITRGPVPPFSYGFGWVIDQERGRRAVLHSGGTPGFSSAIRHYPDDGVTVIVLANQGDRILDHMPMEIAGMVLPAVARRDGRDPDAALSARLVESLRSVLTGRPDPRGFTPAMRVFLSTATARGLGEWIASHGAFSSLEYVQSEAVGPNRVLRYRAVMGDARLWFSFTLTSENEIAQIYWW